MVTFRKRERKNQRLASTKRIMLDAEKNFEASTTQLN